MQATLALLAGEGKQADPAKLAMLRSIYRIGERLRPCPGCPDCDPVEYSRKRYDDGCTDYCSGSGVLPAKGVKL